MVAELGKQQGETQNITYHVDRFEACWNMIVKRLAGQHAFSDFVKKEKIVASLF